MKLLVAVLFIVSLAFAQDTKPSHHPTREKSYHVHHYKLNITLDEKAKTCKGDVTVTLSPLRQSLDTVRLDAAEMAIHGVTINNKPLQYRIEAETLVIALDRKYSYGESLKVNVAYEVSSPKKGLYFTKPDSGYPDKQWQIWSQGEAEDNHFWFPCYDFPNDFSTNEMIATVNDKFMVIGNGNLIDVKTNAKNHTKTYHWFEGRPHVSYLISIIAGEYINVPLSLGKLKIDNYVYKHQKDVAKYSFSKTPDMIDFFSKKIGYPYPWEKFAQTVIQDFMFGGEENVSAVTLTDATIHDARAHLDNSSDGLVSHELAHQWWGDLVTCRDWSQAWLNEGFATYFENCFIGHEKGPDEARKEIHDTQSGLLIQDAGARRRATVSDYYLNPIELFDGHIYGKGACILTMLHDYLGDELFWKSINHYVHKHAFGNVETNDFKIAIQEVTGENLYWFFDEWVYKPGFPEFDVSWSWDSTSLQAAVDVEQVQTIDSLTGLFTVPVTIEVWNGGSPQQYKVVIRNEKEHFTFPSSNHPDLVIFDKGSTVLKRVTTTKPIDEWLYQLKHASDAVDRTIAIEKLRQDADTSRVALGLKDALLHDSFWDVRTNAMNALNSAKKPGPIDLNISGYADKDARVRAAAISGLANYPGDAVALKIAKAAFENDSSYSVAAAALSALTIIDSVHAKEYCEEGLHRDSYRETIRNTALGKLAKIGGEDMLDTIKNYTVYGLNREVRITALRDLDKYWKSNDTIDDLMISFLNDPTSRVKSTVIEILGNRKVKKAVAPLEELLKTETDGRLQKLAKDSIEKIDQNH